MAKALNFSRAAAQLHVTQPALSRQVRDLEEELGCRLLRRGPNARTELTPEGRRLLGGAEEILATTERLKADIRSRATRLNLGHYGPAWLDYFVAALRRFAKKNPRVVLQPVEFTPAGLQNALRGGDVDVALLGAADPGLRREFETQLVARVPARLVMAATHPLAKRRKIRLADLRFAEWVAWDETEFPGRKRLLVDACRRAGFRPRLAHETDSIASMLVRVATSEAVGYSLPMAAKLPHQGVVFTELDDPEAIVFDMYVGTRRGDPRDAVIGRLVAELAAGI